MESTVYKICKDCKQSKKIEDFHTHKQMKDGHLNNCKKCHYIKTKKYAQQNKEKSRAYKDKWINENPEKNAKSKKDYKLNNREKHLIQKSEYAKNNREKYNAWTNHYRASKLKATRKLSEFEDLIMLEIYDKAKLMTKYTGIPYDVDHIVPLVSYTVCGLHAPNNLRVLPKSINQSKNNRYWPDM